MTTLQYLLNAIEYSTNVTGNYTYMTGIVLKTFLLNLELERAVLLFQEDHGLKANGVVDHPSWKIIVEKAVAVETEDLNSIAMYLLQDRFYYSVNSDNLTQVVSTFQSNVCGIDSTGQLDYTTFQCMLCGCTQDVSSSDSSSNGNDHELPMIVIIGGYASLAIATAAILVSDRLKKKQVVITHL